MAFDFRPDGPDFHRNLPVLRKALETVDQGEDRGAIGLHRLLALGAMCEDEDIGSLERGVGA